MDFESTDLKMRRGIRIFFSGGAFIYDVAFLRRLRAYLNNVIKDKTKHIDEPTHYEVKQTKRGGVGSQLVASCSKSSSAKRTSNPDKVFCKACENTKQYRAAIGENFDAATVVHLTDPHPNRQTACNVWVYFTSSNLDVSKKWKEVTCKSCQKTTRYLTQKAADSG